MSEATNHDVLGAWLKRLNKIQHESDKMRARIKSIRNHRPECAARFGNPRLIRGTLNVPVAHQPAANQKTTRVCR